MADSPKTAKRKLRSAMHRESTTERRDDRPPSPRDTGGGAAVRRRTLSTPGAGNGAARVLDLSDGGMAPTDAGISVSTPDADDEAVFLPDKAFNVDGGALGVRAGMHAVDAGAASPVAQRVLVLAVALDVFGLVADRKVLFKRHARCFIGVDAVTAVTALGLAASRADAVAFVAPLVACRLVEHCAGAKGAVFGDTTQPWRIGEPALRRARRSWRAEAASVVERMATLHAPLWATSGVRQRTAHAAACATRNAPPAQAPEVATAEAEATAVAAADPAVAEAEAEAEAEVAAAAATATPAAAAVTETLGVADASALLLLADMYMEQRAWSQAISLFAFVAVRCDGADARVARSRVVLVQYAAARQVLCRADVAPLLTQMTIARRPPLVSDAGDATLGFGRVFARAAASARTSATSATVASLYRARVGEPVSERLFEHYARTWPQRGAAWREALTAARANTSRFACAFERDPTRAADAAMLLSETFRAIVAEMAAEAEADLEPWSTGVPWTLCFAGALAANTADTHPPIEFVMLIDVEADDVRAHAAALAALVELKVLALGESPLRFHAATIDVHGVRLGATSPLNFRLDAIRTPAMLAELAAHGTRMAGLPSAAAAATAAAAAATAAPVPASAPAPTPTPVPALAPAPSATSPSGKGASTPRSPAKRAAEPAAVTHTAASPVSPLRDTLLPLRFGTGSRTLYARFLQALWTPFGSDAVDGTGARARYLHSDAWAEAASNSPWRMYALRLLARALDTLAVNAAGAGAPTRKPARVLQLRESLWDPLVALVSGLALVVAAEPLGACFPEPGDWSPWGMLALLVERAPRALSAPGALDAVRRALDATFAILCRVGSSSRSGHGRVWHPTLEQPLVARVSFADLDALACRLTDSELDAVADAYAVVMWLAGAARLLLAQLAASGQTSALASTAPIARLTAEAGLVLTQMHQCTRAAAAWRAQLDATPTDALAAAELAASLAATAQWAEAVDVFALACGPALRPALEASGEAGRVLFGYGMALAEVGLAPEAKVVLLDALGALSAELAAATRGLGEGELGGGRALRTALAHTYCALGELESAAGSGSLTLATSYLTSAAHKAVPQHGGAASPVIAVADAVVQAHVAGALARALLATGADGAASEQLRRGLDALETAALVTGLPSPELPRLALEHARLAASRGAHAEALSWATRAAGSWQMLLSAVELPRADGCAPSLAAAETHETMASSLLRLGQPDEAQRQFAIALDWSDAGGLVAASLAPPARLALCLVAARAAEGLGAIASMDADSVRAEQAHAGATRALLAADEADAAAAALDDPLTGPSLSLVPSAVRASGRTARAASRAARQRDGALAMAKSELARGFALRALARADAATDAFTRAVKTLERELGHEHPETLLAARHLAASG